MPSHCLPPHSRVFVSHLLVSDLRDIWLLVHFAQGPNAWFKCWREEKGGGRESNDSQLRQVTQQSTRSTHIHTQKQTSRHANKHTTQTKGRKELVLIKQSLEHATQPLLRWNRQHVARLPWNHKAAPSNKRERPHAHTHARTHAHTHTRTHARTHARTHTPLQYEHQPLPLAPPPSPNTRTPHARD